MIHQVQHYCKRFDVALVGGKFYLKIGVWPTQHYIFLHECVVFCLEKWRQKPMIFWVGNVIESSSHFSRNWSKNYAQNNNLDQSSKPLSKTIYMSGFGLQF